MAPGKSRPFNIWCARATAFRRRRPDRLRSSEEARRVHKGLPPPKRKDERRSDVRGRPIGLRARLLLALDKARTQALVRLRSGRVSAPLPAPGPRCLEDSGSPRWPRRSLSRPGPCQIDSNRTPARGYMARVTRRPRWNAATSRPKALPLARAQAPVDWRALTRRAARNTSAGLVARATRRGAPRKPHLPPQRRFLESGIAPAVRPPPGCAAPRAVSAPGEQPLKCALRCAPPSTPPEAPAGRHDAGVANEALRLVPRRHPLRLQLLADVAGGETGDIAIIGVRAGAHHHRPPLRHQPRSRSAAHAARVGPRQCGRDRRCHKGKGKKPRPSPTPSPQKYRGTMDQVLTRFRRTNISAVHNHGISPLPPQFSRIHRLPTQFAHATATTS